MIEGKRLWSPWIWLKRMKKNSPQKHVLYSFKNWKQSFCIFILYYPFHFWHYAFEFLYGMHSEMVTSSACKHKDRSLLNTWNKSFTKSIGFNIIIFLFSSYPIHVCQEFVFVDQATDSMIFLPLVNSKIVALRSLFCACNCSFLFSTFLH